MVNIRRTKDADLAAICDVHRDAFRQGQGQETALKLLAESQLSTKMLGWFKN